jgi:hypothetical protein
VFGARNLQHPRNKDKQPSTYVRAGVVVADGVHIALEDVMQSPLCPNAANPSWAAGHAASAMTTPSTLALQSSIPPSPTSTAGSSGTSATSFASMQSDGWTARWQTRATQPMSVQVWHRSSSVRQSVFKLNPNADSKQKQTPATPSTAASSSSPPTTIPSSPMSPNADNRRLNGFKEQLLPHRQLGGGMDAAAHAEATAGVISNDNHFILGACMVNFNLAHMPTLLMSHSIVQPWRSVVIMM